MVVPAPKSNVAVEAKQLEAALDRLIKTAQRRNRPADRPGAPRSDRRPLSVSIATSGYTAKAVEAVAKKYRVAGWSVTVGSRQLTVRAKN